MSSLPASAQDNALPINYRLGEYQILSVLGHGGFGITYLARDTKLGADVAVKEYFPQACAVRQQTQTIVPMTRAASGGVEDYRWGLEQFLKEARALARFKHNHIVRVLRFLEANGTAYMVMEYEEGQSLAAYLRAHGGFLAEPLLLKIFLPILNGLQAVHEAGVLHLDIKPDNIYLRRDGRPLLIDFGSARQARSGSKSDRKVALTPGYCAPEQYPGHGELGPWTDLYAMGATLYRCITGKQPVDALKRLETFERSRIDPFLPASKIDRPKYSACIREAIDATMQLPPAARPRSAAAVQNGLMGKGLSDAKQSEPGAYGSGFIGVIRTAAVRTKRRMHRGPLEKLIAVLVFAAAMVVVIPKMLIDTGRLTLDELYATIDQTQAQVVEVGRDAKRWVDERVTGKPAPLPVATTRPAAAVPRPKQPDKVIPPFVARKSVIQTVSVQPVTITAVALLPNGQRLAAGGDEGRVRIIQRETGEVTHTLQSGAQQISALAASPDGQWLAYNGADNSIELWDAQSNQAGGSLPGHNGGVTALAFSLDGKFLVSAGLDKSVTLWDVAARTRVRHLISEARADVQALAFSPNGRLLAAADAMGGIRYWNVAGFRELSYVLVADETLTAVAFSPDSKWAAAGGQAGLIKLVRQGIDREDVTLSGTPDTVHALAFSPDGKWLIAAGTHENILLWDLDTGTRAEQLAGHNHGVFALAVSADGQYLVSGGDDGTVRVWR
jgi:Tol biopolymer transport system component